MLKHLKHHWKRAASGLMALVMVGFIFSLCIFVTVHSH